MNPPEATRLALTELNRATNAHGPFRSAHEGYAIIKEELDELWEAIKADPWRHGSSDAHLQVVAEAVQVAAMSLRFLVDLTNDADLADFAELQNDTQ